MNCLGRRVSTAWTAPHHPTSGFAGHKTPLKYLWKRTYIIFSLHLQMQKRNVGVLGEDTLALWASQLGIVANRVQQDRKGWDNLLEFPVDLSSTRGGALDTATEPPKCFVQVKSTDRRIGAYRVSVANLQRLACSPLPAFFLILEFDEQDEPQRASLVHVGPDLASRGLKRLRLISVAPAKLQPHRVHETIRISEHERLTTPAAGCFSAAMRHHVGADLHGYVERKRHWLRHAGYEKGGQQLNIEVRLPSDDRTTQQVLVDLALGIEPNLEVLGGDVRDMRFGIPSPAPITVLPQGGALHVHRKPLCKGELLVASEDGHRTTLSGDVYAPVGFGTLLTQDNLKIRFQSQFIDVSLTVGQSGSITFTLRLPGSDDTCPIDELGRFCDALLMAARAPTPDDVTFELRFMDLAFGTGTLGGHAALDTEAVSVAQIGSNAWAVARRFDLSPVTRVTFGQLLSQEKELKLAHGMLMENPEATRIEFLPADPPNLNREICAPIAFPVRIGDAGCVVAGAAVGLPTRIDGSERYSLSRVRWRHYPCSVRKVGDWDPMSRNAILEDIALTLADGAEVSRWWDRKE